MKEAHFSVSLFFENMFYYIQINTAYPWVKNDDDVCVIFDSLFLQSKG
jgi:hypothetical protein